MSDDTKSSLSKTSSDPQPEASRITLPIWMVVFTLMLVFLGGLYFDNHSGWFQPQVYGPYASVDQLELYQPKSGAAAELARGKAVYEQVCGLCHGADGLGKPGQAPPLAGSEWVMAKGYNRLTHIPLAGLSGSISVAGKDWNMGMAAMGAALPDADLAAVLTYIRSSWGNGASPVAADDVTKIRAALGTRPPPMSHDMLMGMPE
jgi:mono/diheme cytochrome c family protein